MKKFVNDMLGQFWTIFGLFVAWFCLEGSARIVVGWGIIASTAVWAITWFIRKD